MRSFEERLREALRERADGVVPNQPAWEDLLIRPAAEPSPPGHRLWLAVATAAVVVLVPFLVFARYLSRTSHVNVDGGQGQLDPSPSTGSLVAGPPDGSLLAGFSPVSITRISLRVGWALGTSLCGTEVCTELARTRDGGATWHSVPVPTAVATSSPNSISRVRFANASDGWLFGPQLWATHDGGTSWHPVATLGGPVISLEAADGRVWGLVGSAGGVSATVEGAPVGTDDWKPVGPAAAAIGITLHGKVGYAVAPDGALIALGSGPAGMEERGVPCPAATVAAIAAPSDTEVVVVCAADPGAGSSTKTLLLSHNGGRTWSTAGVAPRGGADHRARSSLDPHLRGRRRQRCLLPLPDRRRRKDLEDGLHRHRGRRPPHGPRVHRPHARRGGTRRHPGCEAARLLRRRGHLEGPGLRALT